MAELVLAPLAVVLALSVLGVVLVRRRLAVVEVAGPSMQPALSSGDRVLVRRARLSELRSGLVVVIEKPRPEGGWAGEPPSWPPGRKEWLIKRVAAVPGERRPAAVPLTGPEPDDMFVVLGDNAARSRDSRAIGCVPADRLLGIMVRAMNTGRGAPAG
jgi:signal peptidase I